MVKCYQQHISDILPLPMHFYFIFRDDRKRTYGGLFQVNRDRQGVMSKITGSHVEESLYIAVQQLARCDGI